MVLIGRYRKDVEVIRELIKPIVDEYYPNKANREVMSLYNLITLGGYLHIYTLMGL